LGKPKTNKGPGNTHKKTKKKKGRGVLAALELLRGQWINRSLQDNPCVIFHGRRQGESIIQREKRESLWLCIGWSVITAICGTGKKISEQADALASVLVSGGKVSGTCQDKPSQLKNSLFRKRPTAFYGQVGGISGWHNGHDFLA